MKPDWKISGVILAVAALLTVAVPVFAADANQRGGGRGLGGGREGQSGWRQRTEGISGTVASIDGTLVTITCLDAQTHVIETNEAIFRIMPATSAPVAGSASASARAARPAAESFKAISRSDIGVGDVVTVRGEMNGMSMKATEVIKGMAVGNRGEDGGRGGLGMRAHGDATGDGVTAGRRGGLAARPDGSPVAAEGLAVRDGVRNEPRGFWNSVSGFVSGIFGFLGGRFR